MSNEIDYQKYLSLIIECQEKQDSSITHEWLMDSRADAVKLSNYLRGHGYTVTNRVRKILGRVELFYVGVNFKTLKANNQ